MKIKKQKESAKVSQEQKERLELLQKADEVASKGQQLKIDDTGEITSESELKDWAIQDTDDPEEKFKLYYDGIMKLLREHLPKGKPFETARAIVYDEKNIYLTRGKKKDSKGIRGADSRMGFITDIEVVLRATINWVIEKGTMTDLYQIYYDLNESKGYGHQTDMNSPGE